MAESQATLSDLLSQKPSPRRNMRSGKGVVRTLISKLEAEGVFDTDAINILVGAFDDAWQTLMASDAPFAEDRYRETARLIMAKHIIELVRLGERDQGKLAESALLELSQANLKSGGRPAT